jgi:hypothetical protein
MHIDTGSYGAPATPWDDPRWRRDALAWAESSLAVHGRQPAGREGYGVRLRPWSVVVRIPARDGRVVWFKANPPGSAFEPALSQALHNWAPGRVLAPLAVDTGRAWSLLPDGGPLLAQVLDDERPDPRCWEEPLRQYAALQREIVPRVAELAALGVPDLRPAALPGRLTALLDRTAGLDDVGQLVPQVAAWCTELESSGVSPSLDHSDLHEGQVFHDGAGRCVFFDWGDSALAHPFTSLLVIARLTRKRFGADSPAVLARLRDAYLEPWTGDGHSAADLRRFASLACRVGPVGRALAWDRCFPGTDGRPQVVPDAHAVSWVRELANEPPL